MKTRNILAALLMMLGGTMMADDTRTINIGTTGSEQIIPLPIVQRISFEDSKMVVTTDEGSVTIPISALGKITFGWTDDATAIEALPEQTDDLAFGEGKLAVGSDGLLRVFSTNGALVSVANVKKGANISLEGLPAGIYVVRLGEKTIKVRK